MFIHKGGSVVGKDLSSAAFLAKSLADEKRLRILLFLGNSQKSVSQIASNSVFPNPGYLIT